MSAYDNARRHARTLVVAAALAPAMLLPAVAAHAVQQRPAVHQLPPGNPYIVSVGDSYISGEAGRWAGNTNRSPSEIDALGPTAYYDNATDTGELIPQCHRSKSAEIHIGNVSSLNLACSGAQTSTFTNSAGYFKPGLDFYNMGGRQGQALMLEDVAKTHRVTMVAVSIGGNDFGFGDIVATCVKDFLASTPIKYYYCNQDPTVTAHFTAANIAAVTEHIAQGLRNIRTAMTLAGYPDSSYKILLQNYPAPLPPGADFRYPQTGSYVRQTVGGCGLWNADVDWALDFALPRISAAVFTAASRSGLDNIAKMDISSAFNTRKLCQNTVGLLEEKGLNKWTDPGAVDKTEWIDQIRILTLGTPYFQQESLHPNYWGQLALRNCVRQAYNNGAPHGGTCVMSGLGLNDRGEPVMQLHGTTFPSAVGTGAGQASQTAVTS
jgi:hypothetical protein